MAQNVVILVIGTVMIVGSGCSESSGNRDGSDTPKLFSSCSAHAATGSSPMIDDLDDGDAIVLPNEGRMGSWFVFNDGTGMQDPEPSAAVSAEDCAANPSEPPVLNGRACTSGNGFTEWGGALGVSLNTVDCVDCAYDATVYQGIRFTLSGTVTGALRFEVVTNDTNGTVWGGRCEDEEVCTDAHGTSITPTATASVYEVRFDELLQVGWGTPSVFNPAEVNKLTWFVHLDGTEVNFQNLCVDDVTFF